ncbi:VWA domain-containing protein [Pelagibacterium mangrovi]|uniref:VWA domain-containing protein n=1 Tax=Pelagibacterium mangrovi TaxID=3119828 RepID=UPI002FC951D2
MSLLVPWMLGLLALGGLIWLLHARQRSEVAVSSLMIWQRVLERQSQSIRASWRPRINLLMVLQLLALVALVLALAQPLFGANRNVDHWIYVLDNSASMQRGGSESAGQHARDLLADRFAQAAPNARVSLLVAGIQARPIFSRQPATAEDLADRGTNLPPEDGNADWEGAARLISALHTTGETTQIVVLSDAPVPDELRTIREGDSTLETVIVGSNDGNAGLSASLERNSETGLWTAQGHVRFSGDLSEAPLALDYLPPDGGEPVLLAEEVVRPIDPDEKSAPFAFSFEAPGPGIVVAHIPDDAATFDNRVFFTVSDQPNIARILHIGAGEQPLLTALAAVDGVEITEAAGETDDMDGYDLVIVDGMTLSREPQTHALWIGAAGTAETPVPIAETPIEPTGWRSGHKLAGNIAWQALSIETTYQLPLRADAETLVSRHNTPLLDIAENETGLDIRLAFDPRASNWPTQTGFVVFASQLLDWISPASGAFVGQVCMVGQPCDIDPRLAGGTLNRVDNPDTAAITVPASFIPHRAGLFEITKGDMRLTLPVHPPAIGDFPEAPSSDQGASDLPSAPIALWPWLVTGAAILLVIESVLARRRRDAPKGLLRAFAMRAIALVFALLAIVDLRLPFPAQDMALIVVAATPQTPTPAQTTTLILTDHPPADTGNIDAAIGIDGGLTDATRLAASMLPTDMPGRLLVADAALERDSAFALGTEFAASGIIADVLAPNTPQPNDLWIEALDAPPLAYSGDAFALQARIGAGNATVAELVVTHNGDPIFAETFDLQPGTNRVTIPVESLDAGESIFEVAVNSPNDPEPRNDRAGTVLDVAPAGRIAVLSGETARGRQFADMLATQDLIAETITPEAAPPESAGWQAYDALVLMNMPASSLTTAQQRAIETAVRSDQLGLLILGGANSFGPGGYLETPLDSVSPISSRVPRDKPGVALVFVLDRSSSMAQPVGPLTRLDIAKQATLAAISLLDEDSSVSVVAFDSAARLALPLTSVSEAGFIERSVNQISLGGGTALQRGLSAGLEQIRRTDAAARHIILMTDGLSQPSDYSVLINTLNDNGITLSTVAIGEEADRELVEGLAEQGGGIFHATNDFEALPSILSQEAMRLAGDPVETEPATPYWVERDLAFLLDMPGDLPQIEGFVLTTPKPEAHTMAMVDDSTGQPVPFMAYWQYGLGQVMAMTTDASGDWTRNWQDADDYPRLFSQSLRMFLPSSSGPGETAVGLDDGTIRIAANGVGNAAGMDLVLAEADGLTRPLPSQSTGERAFSASFRPQGVGPYHLSSPEDAWTVTGYANYPERLNWSQRENHAPLIATLTGGSVIAPESDYALPPVSYWIEKSIWPLWVGLALLFFLSDLIIRYFGLAWPRRSKPTPASAQTTG